VLPAAQLVLIAELRAIMVVTDEVREKLTQKMALLIKAGSPL
jgi:hypothetical protein